MATKGRHAGGQVLSLSEFGSASEKVMAKQPALALLHCDLDGLHALNQTAGHAAGDKVIVFVHVRVRLKHNMEWHEGRLADVYTFRHGKAIQMRAFADRRQALEWAGVEASDAN